MRIYDVLAKRKILPELEKLVIKQFTTEHPEANLHEGEVWYHVSEDAKLYIEDREFALDRVMYMNG